MTKFIGILIGMFAIGVMQLILATSLPFIVIDIGGGDLYGWVFSGYMLASIATIPLFSRLADTYGKKIFYILGLSIFAIGSLYGGLAPKMEHLIVARVIQGLGAGIITPVTMAMVTEMFPPEKRGNMIGLLGFVQLLANLLSPPLGSLITKQLGWSWVFFGNVGIIGVSLILALVSEDNSDFKNKNFSLKLSDIDIGGGLIFGGFCVLTVSFSNTLSKQGQWNFTVVIFLVLALLTGIILVFNEKSHKNPVIKVEFFKTKVLRSSIVNSVLAGAIMYGLVTILPLCGVVFAQQGNKIDESRVLLFFMVGITIGMLIGSRLADQLKFKHFTKLLWIMISLCVMYIVFNISGTKILLFNLLITIIGLCTGGIMANFLIKSQNAINKEDRTVLSGIIQLGRYFGASIGVTILTGILPEITLISSIKQFLGAFIVLVLLSVAGLINEIL